MALPEPTMEQGLLYSCSQLFRLKEKKQRLEAELKTVNEEIRELQYRQIPEAMRLLGITQYKRDDGILFYLTSYTRPKVKEGQEDAFKEWLRRMGYGDLIRESVPYQTLGAWYRELDEAGEVPDDADQYLQVEEGVYVGLRRSK